MKTRRKNISKNKILEEKIDSLIAQRDELIKERRISEARITIREIISLCSDLASNYTLLAAELEESDMYDAIELYTQAQASLTLALDNIEYLPFHDETERLKRKKISATLNITRLCKALNSEPAQEVSEQIERPAKRPKRDVSTPAPSLPPHPSVVDYSLFAGIPWLALEPLPKLSDDTAAPYLASQHGFFSQATTQTNPLLLLPPLSPPSQF